jgi:hypothetical protein
LQAPSTSKTFVELLETAFTARFLQKKLIAFHGDKREAADKALLQYAVSNPDKALSADCLTFTPTIGPGVSIEKRMSYDVVFAVAVNSDGNPDVQVLMQQQIQRARDAGDIQVFYGEIRTRGKITRRPSTKEEVFRLLEDDDQQLADVMHGVSTDHLDMLRGAPGERAIYDRSSVTCNLYANNVLGHLQSRKCYVDLSTEDLRRQGVTVVNQLSQRSQVGTAVGLKLSLAATSSDKTLDKWRDRHLISWERFEEIRGMLGSSSGGVTSQDVLNYEIFEAAVYCYAIDYRKVDPQFVDEYVRGKHAKNLMANFQNYERLVAELRCLCRDSSRTIWLEHVHKCMFKRS